MNDQTSTLSIRPDVTSIGWRHALLNIKYLVHQEGAYHPHMMIRRVLTFPERMARVLGLIVLEVQKRGKVDLNDWPLKHMIDDMVCDIVYERNIEFLEDRFYLTCDHPQLGRIMVQRRLREQDKYETIR